MAVCKLELNEAKTKIVYCKDEDRRDSYLHEKFDFLGFTFMARRSKNRWGKGSGEETNRSTWKFLMSNLASGC